ncbi:predicted protein [Pyrenophora tritici-repentis Pt-1C-BFP]|uniref:Uncharacterized protein n=1 Tax=Pyrenophora tritici-repentis (strain Pt-1C-BFP) TaxID=426418 RepID=B2W8W9_PYRTR|nr:uncharacterized protein PTRG_06427 [Pyrenophora tritici-repentis Pt-1C-BFP]EDU49347.1 predicted protein [Pyrenophora tritici-repentis Pt-1C-BFP]
MERLEFHGKLGNNLHAVIAKREIASVPISTSRSATHTTRTVPYQCFSPPANGPEPLSRLQYWLPVFGPRRGGVASGSELTLRAPLLTAAPWTPETERRQSERRHEYALSGVTIHGSKEPLRGPGVICLGALSPLLHLQAHCVTIVGFRRQSFAHTDVFNTA